MARNYDNYTIEFTRSMVRYGYKSFTWFVCRPNYDRNSLHSSDTVWCYTSDDSFDYDTWRNVSKSQFIRYIKSRPSTKVYNQPVI